MEHLLACANKPKRPLSSHNACVLAPCTHAHMHESRAASEDVYLNSEMWWRSDERTRALALEC
eukprot:10838810-Lingulodinium_polyedra.AAC.1